MLSEFLVKYFIENMPYQNTMLKISLKNFSNYIWNYLNSYAEPISKNFQISIFANF